MASTTGSTGKTTTRSGRSVSDNTSGGKRSSLKSGVKRGAKTPLKATGSLGTTKTSPVDVKALRERVGISQHDFARLMGFSIRAIAGWEGGKPLSEAGRQRYAELTRLQGALANVMNESHIAQWLKTPNPAFDGLKPLEVIERGEIDRIWRMIFHLEVGDVV